MEQQPMQPEHVQLNIDQVIQSIKDAAQNASVSPEKQQQVEVVAQQVTEVLESYFNSLKKLSASNAGEVLEQPEIQNYTLSDLEKIGITPGGHVRTPAADGDSILRRVAVVDPGIVVLSNIDSTKYGVIDEMYVPDQYGILAEKISSGLYTSVADHELPGEPVINTSGTVDNIIATPIAPVLTVAEQAPVVPETHHKSLAELLGQVEPVSTYNDSVIGAPATKPAPQPDNAPRPSTPSMQYTPELIVTPEIKQTEVILPISIDRLAYIENSLGNNRPHQSTYTFLSGALQEKWAVNVPAPASSPVITQTPYTADISMVTTTATSGKLDPSSMF